MDKAAPDTPWLIPDIVVHYLRRAGGVLGGIAGIDYWRWVWGWHLGADLTIDETWDIMRRINGFGPHRFEDTWAAVTRSNISFWRSSL